VVERFRWSLNKSLVDEKKDTLSDALKFKGTPML